MAKISGTDPGLVPLIRWEPKERQKPKPPPDIKLCECCHGQLPIKRFSNTNRCQHCMLFFGDEELLFAAGVTNVTLDEAREKLANAERDKWVMIMRRMGLAAPDGSTLELDAGDIMKVARIGFPDEQGGKCSMERTKSTFTVTCKVGPYEVTLFPHEFSSIGFPVIMQLLREKEIVEQFVSDGDEVGHFTPTPELREMIYATFGNLVNAGR